MPQPAEIHEEPVTHLELTGVKNAFRLVDPKGKFVGVLYFNDRPPRSLEEEHQKRITVPPADA